MNACDPATPPDRSSELPRLPRDTGGPVFAEPWQAQAFALAVTLSERGHYTWKEWTAALTDQLQAAARRGEPDDGSRYYEHWLAALETLVAEKGLADPNALRVRKEAWVDAYRETPHGQPVQLRHTRAPDLRWIALGLAGAFIAYWGLQNASLGSFAAGGTLGALLGMRHAFEPDHLAAISTLMTGERSGAKAAWLGTSWGAGHTVTLLAAGGLLVALQAEMPADAARLFEIAVVLLLVGFGVRAIHLGARRQSSMPTHTHRISRSSSSRRDARASLVRSFSVGAVHGLAGSGALVAVVVSTLPSATSQLGYLVLFGVGSTMAMAVISGLLGWPLARLGTNHSLARCVSLAVGGISIALGLLWSVPILQAAF